MLIYVCARLRIFSNSGAKIVKNSHIRKYSAENRLEKWILKAKKAFLAAIYIADRGHVITRSRNYHVLAATRSRRKNATTLKIPPRLNAGPERRHFRASRTSLRGDFCLFGGKNCSQYGEKPKKRKFMNDFFVFSCTIRKKVVTLRGF